VTAIPSQHHAELVQDFGQRLAAALGLPFVPALRKHATVRPQKEMQNSATQLRNILKAFQVVEAPRFAPTGAGGPPKPLASIVDRLAQQLVSHFGSGPVLPPAPVLLVDDMVDSGWTLTLAAVLLQCHGSGPVYPFALAKASPRGG
jgi:ATP-dependent DNA helicase RecQ